MWQPIAPIPCSYLGMLHGSKKCRFDTLLVLISEPGSVTLKSGSGQIGEEPLAVRLQDISEAGTQSSMSLSNIKKVQFDFRVIYANFSAQNKIPEHNRIKLPATYSPVLSKP